ncbi:sigma-70 family RNA polymerase sigma factor [Mesorhizobium sp. INR15]|uniref:sigma-70 family RNA polymerase sigma factor n=1 Tax=Mesorhizobium sp. INR15 TaxID=2654248 RepID=UPI00189659DF|nr:sigma-70 family RNA polymerase sigma factor [Mesorhizobium sp. INR15]QPC91555.1 sigma-70 family RNA polymerase sigma factor [Mesorhizobium sp. INR15]
MLTRDDITKLILRTGAQDRPAFDILYRHTCAKLFGVCLRILGDRGEAEDALQEIYIKIWAKADRFAISELSPISWLVAIARNHSIDRIRARRPPSVGLSVAQDIADPAPGPDALVIAATDAERLRRCIDGLASEKADAVRGAYLDGESYAELARRYNVPINTMRTWLRRSLIKIRAQLEG